MRFRNARPRRGPRRLHLACESLESRTLLAAPVSSIGVEANDLIYDTRRQRLYMTTWHGRVERYDLATRTLLSPIEAGNALFGADITPDGRWLYVADHGTGNSWFGSTQSFVRRIDLDTGAVTSIEYPKPANEGAPWDLAILSDGTMFVVNGGISGPDAPLRQINLATGTVTVRSDLFPVPSQTQLEPAGDHSVMLVTIPQKSVATYEAGGSAFASRYTASHYLSGSTVAVNRDGSLMSFEEGSYYLSVHRRNLDRAGVPDQGYSGGIGGGGPRTMGGHVFDPGRDVIYTVDLHFDNLAAFSLTDFRLLSQSPIGENVYDASPFNRGEMAYGGAPGSAIGEWVFLSTMNDVKAIQVGGPPTADAGGPYNVLEGGTLYLYSSSATSAPPHSIAKTEWDLDYDGVTFDVDRSEHQPAVTAQGFDGPGTRTVAFRVTDSAGQTAIDTAVVNVTNVAPTLSVSGAASVAAGTPYTLTLSANDPGVDAVTWTIDWGDGAVTTTTAGATSATHTYPEGHNNYLVRWMAADEDGSYGGVTPRTITVTGGPNDPPTGLTLTAPTSFAEGATGFQLVGVFDDLDSADAHTATINWGDGTPNTVINILPGSKAFSAFKVWDDDNPPGTFEDVYTITVAVSDGIASDTETVTTVVRNVPPRANAGPDRTINEGASFSVTGSSGEGPSETVTWRWRLLDAAGAVVQTADTQTLVIPRPDDGVYTLELTVADDDGGVSTDTAVLTVRNVAPAVRATVHPVAPAGEPFLVTFSASDVGPDTIGSWTINWGDGVVETVPGTAAGASHVYAGPSPRRLVVVTATDEDGSYAATPTVSLDRSVVSTGILPTDGLVYDVAFQPDGKFLTMIGNPVYVGSKSGLWQVRRYLSEGTLEWDRSFGAGGITSEKPHLLANATGMVLQPDGKIVVAGFEPGPGGPVPALGRYNADGRPDPLFGVGGFVRSFGGHRGEFWGVALQPDGKIVTAARIGYINRVGADQFAMRFNTDGSLDTSFGDGGRTALVNVDNGRNKPFAVLIDPAGNIVLGGATDWDLSAFGVPNPPVASKFGLVRFTPDGRLDLTFGDGGKVATPVHLAAGGNTAVVRTLALGPGDTIIAAGEAATNVSQTNAFALARYRPDGSLDTTFGGDGIVITRFSASSGVASLLPLPDGRLVAGGGNQGANGAQTGAFALARYLPDGSPDVHFGAGGMLTTQFTGGATPTRGRVVVGMTVLADGRLVAGGTGGFTRYVPEGAPVTVLAPGVVGRHVFYNNSAFDGRSVAADAADDGAIAPGKAALLPGQVPTLANVTSYSRGLNGVMIDLVGRTGAEGALAFHTARSPGAADWAAAPAPAQILRRAGAGAGGSDRITVVWADGAIANRWLRVTVAPDTQGRYGDVFYFGNLVGETGAVPPPPPLPTGMAVDGADLLATRAAASGRAATIGSLFDFNCDGWVNSLDVAIVRRAMFSTLPVAPAVPVAAAALPAAPRPRRSIYTVLNT